MAEIYEALPDPSEEADVIIAGGGSFLSKLDTWLTYRSQVELLAV